MSAIKHTSNNKHRLLSLVYTRQQSSSSVRRKAMRRPVSEKVALPTLEGYDFEEVKNIISLEAQGNYTLIRMVDNRKVLVCKTLGELEEMIRSEAFIRIHRSHTINLNKLSKYVKGKGGYVVMEDKSTLSVSSGRKKEFLEVLEAYF